MAKRQRMHRRIGQMLPYGKPDTVTKKVIVKHQGRNGAVWTTESLEFTGVKDVGAPEDTRVEPARRTKDFHHDDCHGRTGVSNVFWRDGRYWCQGCYELRYSANPWLEPEKWGKPQPQPAAPRPKPGPPPSAKPKERKPLGYYLSLYEHGVATAALSTKEPAGS